MYSSEEFVNQIFDEVQTEGKSVGAILRKVGNKTIGAISSIGKQSKKLTPGENAEFTDYLKRKLKDINAAQAGKEVKGISVVRGVFSKK